MRDDIRADRDLVYRYVSAGPGRADRRVAVVSAVMVDVMAGSLGLHETDRMRQPDFQIFMGNRT
jgi:hypothetical protein